MSLSSQQPLPQTYSYRDLEGKERDYILAIMKMCRPIDEGCSLHACHRRFRIDGRIYEMWTSVDGKLLAVQECALANGVCTDDYLGDK